MNRTAWIAIGVGAAAAVGVGVYLATRPTTAASLAPKASPDALKPTSPMQQIPVVQGRRYLVKVASPNADFSHPNISALPSGFTVVGQPGGQTGFLQYLMDVSATSHNEPAAAFLLGASVPTGATLDVTLQDVGAASSTSAPVVHQGPSALSRLLPPSADQMPPAAVYTPPTYALNLTSDASSADVGVTVNLKVGDTVRLTPVSDAGCTDWSSQLLGARVGAADFSYGPNVFVALSPTVQSMTERATVVIFTCGTEKRIVLFNVT